MNKGFYIIMAAQFFSALADNALLIAAIAILVEMKAPPEYAPLLKTFFTVSYVVLAARYYKIGVPGLADAMAPAIPLAQAIGRLGNYFNQELFGKPSTLPWAVRIDLEHRPSANGLPLDQGGIPKYPGATSFQPTFLYEALWNLGAFGLLVWIDSKKLLRQGKMLPAYVVAASTSTRRSAPSGR